MNGVIAGAAQVLVGNGEGNYFVDADGNKIPVSKKEMDRVNAILDERKKVEEEKGQGVQKVPITLAWSDILKVRERVKLVSLLGIVFAFISFAQNTIFAGLGLQLTLTGIFVLIFGVFFVLNEKGIMDLRLKIAGKLQSSFKGAG